MKFIKLHWFEKESSYSSIIYKGEIAISVDEITFVTESEFKLKNVNMSEANKQFLFSLNKDGRLSIVHTKIFELQEILVIEAVRDIYDFIR